MGKPLITRFEENSYDLYHKYSLRDGAVDSEPLIETKPDDPNIESPPSDTLLTAGGPIALRHVSRMAEYQKLSRGKLFMDKQDRLQNQNTFKQTRKLDKDFITAHSEAGISRTRHKEPTIGSFLSGTFLSEYSTRGHLQLETQNDVRETVRRKLTSDRGSLFLRDDNVNSNGRLGGFIDAGIGYITGRIRDAILGLNPFPKILEKNFGVSGPISRPEHRFSLTGKSYFDYLSPRYDGPFKENRDRMVMGQSKSSSIGRGIKSGNVLPYVLNDNRTSYKDFVQFLKNTYDVEKDPRRRVESMHKDTRKKIRYFKDLTQIMRDGIIDKSAIGPWRDSDTVDLIFYSMTEKPSKDTDVSLMSVRFRALIEDVKESVNPTYTEKSYVGRIEKFYVLDTVVRDVKLTFNLQAFSELELQHIWSKVNYLSSLAYPQTYSGGYATPTIFKFTMGNVWKKQSTIIKNITHMIVDNNTSWDIHEQLPTSIQVTMDLRFIDDALFSHGNAAYRGRKGKSVIEPNANMYQIEGTGRYGTNQTNRTPAKVGSVSIGELTVVGNPDIKGKPGSGFFGSRAGNSGDAASGSFQP